MSSCLVSVSDDGGVLSELGSGMNYQLADPYGADKAQRENQFQIVKWLHFTASVIFLAEIIVFAALGIDDSVVPTVGKPVNCDGPICETEVQTLDNMNLTFLLPLFVALAYFDHLVTFLQCQFNEDAAKKWMFMIGANPYRWMEYSLSTSVMLVTVAIVSGVTDVHLWILLFFMTTVGMGCRALLELLPRNERPAVSIVPFQSMRVLVFALVKVSTLIPWVVIACYFFRAIGQNPPAFIYVAFFGTLAMFIAQDTVAFCHNILCDVDFATAEILYVLISVLGKTLLAADLCAGFRDYK